MDELNEYIKIVLLFIIASTSTISLCLLLIIIKKFKRFLDEIDNFKDENRHLIRNMMSVVQDSLRTLTIELREKLDASLNLINKSRRKGGFNE